MADIFLSYASRDRDRVKPLVEAFEQQGWTVWWDRHIPPGKTWHQLIQESLDAAKCVVVVWSQHSVKSDWVIVEAEEGKARGTLIPVLIDDVKPPLSFRLIQAARLIDWQGAAAHPEWKFLLATINAAISKPKPTQEVAQPAATKSALSIPIPTDHSPNVEPRVILQRGPQRWLLLSGAAVVLLGIVLAVIWRGSSSDDKTEGTPTPAPDGSAAALASNEFNVVMLDASGKVRARRKGQAQYVTEELGDDVKLVLAALPGGTFTMGSPASEAEREEDESPQHQVTVRPFQIGKFEVTQAQWRAVAGWPKVSRDLNAEPSYFKGDNLPVEQVRWAEAVEFCMRLARKTRKDYRLPTEAEWEYAARAGTTTPFAFGQTITPEFVNYDGNYPYAVAPKGEYREKTIAVGSLGVANAFGLFDMHGNVSEWCQDVWHPKYEGAPVDGSAWSSDGDATLRVLRGGDWTLNSWSSRSALRNRLTPDTFGYNIGFRVVMAARTGNP